MSDHKYFKSAKRRKLPDMVSQNYTPPCNIVAEQAILGAMLLWSESLESGLALVKAEHFYREDNQAIFTALQEMHSKSLPVDLVSVIEYMGRSTPLPKSSEMYISMLLEAVPVTRGVENHCKIVREKALRRSMIDSAVEVMGMARDEELEIDEIVAEAQSSFDLEVVADEDDECLIDGLIIENIREAEERGARTGGIYGKTTGIKILDLITNGMEDTDLIIVAARPSMGKAQPLNAKILTPFGFTTMGDIRVGSEVVGSDGRGHRVKGVYPQGVKEVYRVTLSDGSSVECCDEHLWFTQTRNERRRGSAGSVKPLKDIRATILRPDGGKQNHALPLVAPVEFAAQLEPLLDPYLLGVILGDGSIRPGCVRIDNPELDIMARVDTLLPCGDKMTRSGEMNGSIVKKKRNNECSTTRRILSYYGYGNELSYHKFIPISYLHGSVETRIQLLRGLMDTDGYVVIPGGQSVEYSTSSEMLARDVEFLVRSLGGIVTTAKRIPHYTYKGERLEGADNWRLVLWFPNGLVPVSSEKHLAKWEGLGNRCYKRAIAKIEMVRSADCQCIAIDSEDHLYVTDDFILTHNTSICTQIAEHVGLSLQEPVYIASLEMSKKQLSMRMMCSRANVDLREFKSGQMSPGAQAAIDRVDEEFFGSKLMICDKVGMRPAELLRRCRRFQRRHGLGLVIVDYLQLMHSNTREENRTQEIGSIAIALKDMARQLGVPVIALSQLSRAVERRDNKRPMLSDLNESGAIEAAADMVWFLYRENYYAMKAAFENKEQASVDSRIPEIAEIIIGKHRKGQTGIVKVDFIPAYTRFQDIAEEDALTPTGF